MTISTIALAAALCCSQAAPAEEANKEKKIADKVKIYNVVILDQSGSMDSIKNEAMSGYNETVQTIKAAQKKHAASQEHFVTLVLFDTMDTKTVYHLTPCDQAKELTSSDYKPNAGTPLYDAMGMTLNKVRYALNEGSKHKVLVSIITDGMENSSKEYTGPAVKKLVDELKGKGWVFTYIGANQDVEKVAATLSVQNTMSFAPTASGTKSMFTRKNASRSKWFDRVAEGEDEQTLQEGFFDEEDEKK